MKATPRSLQLNAAWLGLSIVPTPVIIYGALHASIRMMVLAVVLQAVLTVLAGSMMFFRYRDTTRVIRTARGRPCLRCGFDLTGLDERGVCPECGRPYDVWASVRKWRSILHDTRGLDTPPQG